MIVKERFVPFKIFLIFFSLAYLAVLSLGFKMHFIGWDFFYFIPIAMSALWFSITGGVIAAVLAGTIKYFIVLIHPQWKAYEQAIAVMPYEVIAFITLALLLGGFIHYTKGQWKEFQRFMEGDAVDPFGHFYYLDILEMQFQICRAHGGTFSIAILDLDFFRKINNELGLVEGDVALKLFGKLLLANTRAVDIATRYVGDEFLIIFPNTNARQAKAMVDDLRERINMHRLGFKIRGVRKPFSFCAGIVEYSPSIRNTRDFFRSAYAALYEAKEKAPGTTVVIDKEGQEVFSNRRNWERVEIPEDAGISFYVYLKDGKKEKVKLSNLSLSGALCLVPKAYDLNEMMDIEIQFKDGTKVNFSGRIVWRQDETVDVARIGIFMIPMTPHQKFVLSQKLKDIKLRA